MGRTTNYSANIYKQLEDALKLIDKLTKENKSLKLENSLLKDENNSLKLQLERKDILADMDCTCSSIPSSKSNFKTGISNSRKASDKEPGAQVGHKAHFTSKEKIQKEINEKNIKVIVKNINKNKSNSNEKPIIRYVKDAIIIPVIYEYRIYPDRNGKFDIPEYLNHSVSYGTVVQTLAMDLYYNRNVSTDNIKQIFNDLLDYTMSKGTIINFQKKLESNLRPETRHILVNLKKEIYLHVDESKLNIDGKSYNIHNASSEKYTMQWVHKNKSHAALEEIGFLNEYSGILVKDGTHLYDKFAKSDTASCNAHINRYLIGSNKGVYHNGEERMILFLNGLKRHKNKLIRKGYKGITDNEYKTIVFQYRAELNRWKEELERDKKINPLYDEERKLCTRLLEDEKKHLLFIRNFLIPYTNNRAELDIRGVKGRQKVGIFRQVQSAERYVTIKSCLSTYRKNKVNVFDAIRQALMSNTIIV